ncbi:hypothetical protein [Anaerococcus octavius]|uniref:DUF4179 domain-containing protein n=1 Tax=Anaerococcus octavius TaxID=54007 RepID=A0A2I1M8Y0_9FIRM|nr:hypothetical protein [Anaerococcus octavius]PKZ16586.1 hypothetical protein CYJ34_05140 [Anaerococcus octavius]
MTSIYDKINDIDFDTDSIELNDIEKEKMFRSAKSYAKKTNKSKFVASSAAALLIVGLMTPQVRAEVLKFTTDIKVSMMDAFGASPDSYKYTTELDESVKVGNDCFVIENIAFEDNKAFINTLRDSDGSIESQLPENEANIYKIVVDGVSYKALGSSGNSGLLEDGKTISEVSMIDFDKEFPTLDNADVELYYTNGNSTEIISTKASTNTVNEENVIFAKDQKLKNGSVISLMKLNPITMTAIIKNLEPDYSYQIEGTNNEGKTFLLDERIGDNSEVTFIYNKDFSDMSLDEIKDAEEINFVLKKGKNKIDNESGKEEYRTIEKFTYKK